METVSQLFHINLETLISLIVLVLANNQYLYFIVLLQELKMRNSDNIRLRRGFIYDMLYCTVFERTLSLWGYHLGGCVMEELQHWGCLSARHG